MSVETATVLVAKDDGDGVIVIRFAVAAYEASPGELALKVNAALADYSDASVEVGEQQSLADFAFYLLSLAAAEHSAIVASG